MDRTRRALIGFGYTLAALLALPAVVALALLVGVLYHLYVVAITLRLFGGYVKSLAGRLASWRPAIKAPDAPVTLALPRRR